MAWGFLDRYRSPSWSGPGRQNGGQLLPDDQDDDEPGAGIPPVQLDYEVAPEAWAARPVEVPAGWRAATWPERPIYFVDGKENGETVEWLRAPGGYPAPLRLAEIGATVVRVEDGICRRVSQMVERVVALPADFFPWDEVEEFAVALQQNGLRLLPAKRPEPDEWFEPAALWRATKNRTNTERDVLEETVLSEVSSFPTIVDGRLEAHSGGIDRNTSPVAGVIKTHRRRYLHDQGMRVLHSLAPGERTPLFAFPEEGMNLEEGAKFPAISWYVRLSGRPRMPPDYAIVRVEVPLRWFEAMPVAARDAYVNQLSRFLVEYRCRSTSYPRAAISLHPIVRAEELLGALFTPWEMLAQRFYRMAGL